MLIHVVDPLVPGPPATTDVDDIPTCPGIRQVAWVPVPFRLPFRDVGDYLSEAAPSWLIRQADLVLLGMATKPEPSTSAWAGIIHRLENRPLAIAYHEADAGKVRTLIATSFHADAPTLIPAESHESLLDNVRSADVLAMMSQSAAALPPHESLHYLGPDGKSHYASFLRAGLALRSSDEHERLSFWLAPHLAGTRALLVDHWAIMGLAQHAANYANRILFARPSPVAVTSLRRYDESVDELVSRLRREFTASDRQRLAILISVIGSGRLSRRLRDVAARLGEEPREVGICASLHASSLGVPVLAHLGSDFRAIDDCIDCTDKRTVIPIEPDSYLLQLAAFTKHEAVRRPDAEGAREFFATTGAIGRRAAYVHRTHADGRHQAFYVDVGALLDNNPMFRGALEAQVNKMSSSIPGGKVDVLIAPTHEVAQRLASEVAGILNTDVVAVDERRLDSVEGEVRDRLLSATSVCVVDDVVITGGRILGYRNRLIELRRRYGVPEDEREFALACVVGVARPRHESALQGIRDITHHTEAEPRFFAVGELFLPNWDHHQCPWCHELAILNGLYDKTSQSGGYLTDRIRRLTDVHAGLSDGLFIGSDALAGFGADSSSEAEWLEIQEGHGVRAADFDWANLNPGSVFGDVQDADLMLSVASALQTLRSRPGRGDGVLADQPRLDEAFRTPIAKVLDPALYFYGRYYEPVLVAAFLRASHCHDIRVPVEEDELTNMLRDHLLKAPAAVGLSGELAFSAARGWLPKIPGVDLDLSSLPVDVAAVVSDLLVADIAQS